MIMNSKHALRNLILVSKGIYKNLNPRHNPDIEHLWIVEILVRCGDQTCGTLRTLGLATCAGVANHSAIRVNNVVFIKGLLALTISLNY